MFLRRRFTAVNFLRAAVHCGPKAKIPANEACLREAAFSLPCSVQLDRGQSKIHSGKQIKQAFENKSSYSRFGKMS